MISFRLLNRTHVYKTSLGFTVRVAFRVWDGEQDDFVYCGEKYHPSGRRLCQWTYTAKDFRQAIRNGQYIPVKS